METKSRRQLRGEDTFGSGEDLVDSFVVSGVRHEEIFEAIIQEIGTLRQALKRNADPADDRTVKGFLDEPSNDWPAADDR